MISDKEIMVGNWIRCYDHTFRIGNIEAEDGFVTELFNSNEGRFDLRESEGIPLSPELLIKCGFWKADGYNFDLGDLILHDMFDGKDNDCEAYLKAGIATIYIKNIKYLHELQNLYWCLTQKELEVNL